MKRRSALAAAAVLALAGGWAWWSLGHAARVRLAGRPPGLEARGGAQMSGPTAGPNASVPSGPLAGAPSSSERSQLVEGLNSPSGDIHADLRMIDQVFLAYRSGTRQLNPIGENREITAALTGKNKLGFAFIPPDCPAINAKGELCDRWGTPYFFHQLSGQRMGIRSAGPDKEMWTADDQVLTP